MSVTLPVLADVEALILTRTNRFRQEQKLAALVRVTRLDVVARDYAAYLARSATFSHTADGRQPAERAERAGYQSCQFAENLALHGHSRGFATEDLARLAVEGWKGSPGHRRNMLLAGITEIGVGVAKDPRAQRYISVQVFGRPLSLNRTFRIRNETARTIAYTLDGTAQTLEARTMMTHQTCDGAVVAFEAAVAKSLPTEARRPIAARDGETMVLAPGPRATITFKRQPGVIERLR